MNHLSQRQRNVVAFLRDRGKGHDMAWSGDVATCRLCGAQAEQAPSGLPEPLAYHTKYAAFCFTPCKGAR